MATKVFVSNLPAGTTAEELREFWEKKEAPILGIEPVEGGNPDQLAFAVELDIDPSTARLMVDRRRGSFFKGSQIKLYAPMRRD